MDEHRERADLQELDRMLSGLAGDLADGMKRRERRRRVGRVASVTVALVTVASAVWMSRDSTVIPSQALEPALDVASSRPFVLFPTSRDDMTVIWLLAPEAP